MTSAGEVGLTYWRQHDRPVISEGSWSWSWSTPKRQNNKLHQKQVFTHVALCGLERRQARLIIGPPEEYAHGPIHSILTLTLLHLLTFLKSDSLGPRDGIGRIMAICQQPYTYVDLASGSSHIALAAGKAGSPQARIFWAFKKRDTPALAALHKCRVCCVSSWDSYELPLKSVSCVLIRRPLAGCGPAAPGCRGAGAGRWLLIRRPRQGKPQVRSASQ